jgi:hypothetical protein
MPIATKVVSSNLTHGEVYWIQHYVIKFDSDFWQVSESPSGSTVSITETTDRHHITEILLKVVLKHHDPHQ